MIGPRYRVVSLLGRGGMGEVYRADDLKLAQPVALKFLPEALERDPQRLERFLNEVRVALRVSHSNVCRVYDVGEADGRHFISMEYVDGEDLASLLRRIGRFPQDRAARVARQLCAGLAAAHDRGVLHRDLKPANVMIDGEGQVKITDFGLSSMVERIEGAEARAGTPAYMSPEQLDGREATQLSDIYALGLVLYELFTGERAFGGDSPAEVARQRTTSTPESMTSRVDGLDPAVERIVDRCLQANPASRPAGALQVAAALPGGDPLAAALAAGETPSPEMVANAVETVGLRPAVAFGCAIGVMLVFLGLTAMLDAGRDGDPGESPEKLAIEAERMLALSGVEPARHTEWSIEGNNALLHSLAEASNLPDRWQPLEDDRLPGTFFWRRWSPQRLASSDLHRSFPLIDDPRQHHPGSGTVATDLHGRLLLLDVIPPAGKAEVAVEREAPWQALFDAAKLDLAAFSPSAPVRPPPSYCDEVAAWSGVLPGSSATPVTVQAGAYRGRPVYFAILFDWGTPVGPPSTRPGGAFTVAMVIVCLFSCIFAVRNLRTGRGDLHGASCLALAMLVMILIDSVLHSRVSQIGLLGLASDLTLGTPLAHGLLHAFVVGASYLAIEPYARKLWPRSLVSWARLVGGRLRDPLIGRDIVAGGVGAVAMFFVGGLVLVGLPAAMGLGGPPAVLMEVSARAATDARGAAVGVLGAAEAAMLAAMGQFVALLIGRLLLRNRWAAALFSTLPATALLSGMFKPYLPWTYGALVGFTTALVIAFLLIRFGLVAALTARFVQLVFTFIPTTLDLTSWFADSSAIALFSIAAFLGYGAWIAVGGRALMQDPLRES
jgi:serine/threonine-protein kinase